MHSQRRNDPLHQIHAHTAAVSCVASERQSRYKHSAFAQTWTATLSKRQLTNRYAGQTSPKISVSISECILRRGWPCPDSGVPLYRRRGLRRLRARHALGLVLYSEPPLTSQHARGRSRTRARLRLARAPGARFAKIAATAALCGTVARLRAVRPRAATLVVLDSGAVLCLGPRARAPSSWRYRERRGAPRPRGRGAF